MSFLLIHVERNFWHYLNIASLPSSWNFLWSVARHILKSLTVYLITSYFKFLLSVQIYWSFIDIVLIFLSSTVSNLDVILLYSFFVLLLFDKCIWVLSSCNYFRVCIYSNVLISCAYVIIFYYTVSLQLLKSKASF